MTGNASLKIRSRWWFLLPIIFHVIGGVIAYLVLREDDPRLAMSCFCLGIIITAVESLILLAILASPGGINNILPDYYG